MQMKQMVLELAYEVGFQRTVIASVDPMIEESMRYQSWVDQGYAATMGYLTRDPAGRHDPKKVFAGAKSVVMASVSYFSERPARPGDFFGNVACYAVGLDYHTVLRAKLRLLKARIEAELGRNLTAKAFTDDVALNELGLAKRSGLGFKGRHTLIIGPKLSGSYNFIGELFSDLELEADEPYLGTCGKCFRCGEACPTQAILPAGGLNANLCISFLTIENKGGIPLELRPKIGRWVFGCDICQDVCPYNQRPPLTPWQEFRPESGVGHYLDLPELLSIKTDAEFLARFQKTPLARPKRRGILRNALVVLGNILQESGNADVTFTGDASKVVRRIYQFATDEADSMLREHAAWALAQFPQKEASAKLEKLMQIEPDAEAQALMLKHLNCLRPS